MPTSYTDTFTDTAGTDLPSHTPDGGGTWSSHPYAYGTSSQITSAGRARFKPTAGPFTVSVMPWSGTPATADYSASADVYLADATGSGGVACRIDPINQVWIYAVYQAAAGVLFLGQNVSGTDSTVATTAVMWSIGSTHRIELVVSGTSASVFVDGALAMGPATVVPAGPGKSGLYFVGDSGSSDSNGVHVDNFLGLDTTPALSEPPPSWRSYPEVPSYWRPNGYTLADPPPVSKPQTIPFFPRRRPPAFLIRVQPIPPSPIVDESPPPSWRSYPEVPSYWRPNGYTLVDPSFPPTSKPPTIPTFPRRRDASFATLQQLIGDPPTPQSPPISNAPVQPVGLIRRAAAFLVASQPTLDTIPPPSLSVVLGLVVRQVRTRLQTTAVPTPVDAGIAPTAPIVAGYASIPVRRSRVLAPFRTHANPPLEAPSPCGTDFNIYRDSGAGTPIYYTVPVDTVTGLAWTSPGLPYPRLLSFGVRAFNPSGEEKNLDCALTIELDAAGFDVTRLPIAPYSLRAVAKAGGTVRVEWHTVTTNRLKRPTAFNVYYGTTGVDYGFVRAVVDSTGQVVQGVDLTGLADGVLYSFAVRALNATGVEQNTMSAQCKADATGPTAVVNLTIATLSEGS